MIEDEKTQNTDKTVDSVKESTVLNTDKKTNKRRGRKPNPNKKVYFGPEEEAAFVEFVNCENENRKNDIFSKKLYYPFTKMIESIIRRYNLFTPDEEFEETFHDTMSFLITKISNFDTSKNKKAYSYCGTICKNYLILKRTQQQKKQKKQLSYDLLYPNSRNDNRTESTLNKEITELNTEIIKNVILRLEEYLLSENAIDLTENDKKVGNALLQLMINWEDIFHYLGSKKFNKSCALQFIRDYTDLQTKDIRESMKKYKELYFDTKDFIINGRENALL